MTSLEEANLAILLSGAIGILISAYSYYVKVKFMQNPKKYRAVCDISEHISCSRVLTSEYGSGFGIVGKLFGEKSSINFSNSILGIMFYALQMILTAFNSNNDLVQLVSFSASFLSIVGSIYLAYILYFVLKDFCIVCNLSYVLNAIIFYFNWQTFINSNK